MNYRLLGTTQEKNVTEQILANRNVPKELWSVYFNPTFENVSPPEKIADVDTLKRGVVIIDKIRNSVDIPVYIIVDSDCDGFTSAALLMNYFHLLIPDKEIKYIFHEGKGHGLSDTISKIPYKDYNYGIVIVPDAGSNDFQEQGILSKAGWDVLILDHHLIINAPVIDTSRVVLINNQINDYPNKFLSGVGVVWQFCRILDQKYNVNYANKFLDLVSIGNLADVMSFLSIETKFLILKGLEKFTNPFLHAFADRNEFVLGNHITPIKAAFYIAPYINAMNRSGTLEEKTILFKSMLDAEAETVVPSIKRGHKPGDTETILTQALRVVTNVKNRQTREVDKTIERVESEIKKLDLASKPVIVVTLGKDEAEGNVIGLIANKIMSKYQRNTIIMVLQSDNVFRGSGRGYNCDFRQACENTKLVEYAQGHERAFGVAVKAEDINNFYNYINELLGNLSTQRQYDVDFIYNNGKIPPQDIYDIAALADHWGQDFNEPYLLLKNLSVTKEMLELKSPDKKPTLIINIPNTEIELIQFGSSKEEFEALYNKAPFNADIIGKASVNEWMGNTTPQLYIEEIEIDEQEIPMWMRF